MTDSLYVEQPLESVSGGRQTSSLNPFRFLEAAMSRLAALLLCSTLAVCAAIAAPAPQPKTQNPGGGPWFKEWDKPIDPMGDCRFDRNGNRLTITVPGKGHLGPRKGRLATAPHLMRDVEGDFSVQVRVSGSITPAGGEGMGCILLMDGNKAIQCFGYNPLSDGPMFIRIDRKGTDVNLLESRDGKHWQNGGVGGRCSPVRSRRLKVGVLAEMDVPGVFKATFDQFKLTPLGEKTR